jgi:hypothetical protein
MLKEGKHKGLVIRIFKVFPLDPSFQILAILLIYLKQQQMGKEILVVDI